MQTGRKPLRECLSKKRWYCSEVRPWLASHGKRPVLGTAIEAKMGLPLIVCTLTRMGRWFFFRTCAIQSSNPAASSPIRADGLALAAGARQVAVRAQRRTRRDQGMLGNSAD